MNPANPANDNSNPDPFPREIDFSEFADDPSEDAALSEQPPSHGRLSEVDLNDPAYLDDLAKRRPNLAKYLSDIQTPINNHASSLDFIPETGFASIR